MINLIIMMIFILIFIKVGLSIFKKGKHFLKIGFVFLIIYLLLGFSKGLQTYFGNFL